MPVPHSLACNSVFGREISLHTKGRVYQAVVRSILLYGCETRPVRVADESMLEVFPPHSTRKAQRLCDIRGTVAPPLPYKFPTLLLQRKLRWFGHAARRPDGELIKGLLLPTSPHTWRRRTGGQLKTWATTIKADLEHQEYVDFFIDFVLLEGCSGSF